MLVCVTEVFFDIGVQLWVSMDLGRNWAKIGDNVPSGRYYWRRLGSDIEGDLSTVYYEQKTSANSNCKLYLSICRLFLGLYLLSMWLIYILYIQIS